MSTCPQDELFQTLSTETVACENAYADCAPGSVGNPCCPDGTIHLGESTCDTEGVKQYQCLPVQPSMDAARKHSCCFSVEPEGGTYCGTGWCSASTNCQDYKLAYCRSNPNSEECQAFCETNSCDCPTQESVTNEVVDKVLNSDMVKKFTTYGLYMTIAICLFLALAGTAKLLHRRK